MSLEVVECRPRGAARANPVLMVHGGYMGAWAFAEHFLPFLAEHGYHALALSLSGHGRSPGRARLDRLGLADYQADLRAVARALPAPPLLVGHSMGALLVQRHLRDAPAAGAVLMATVPPWGLCAPALGLALGDPPLLWQSLALLGHGPRRASAGDMRRALFAQPLDEDRARRYFRHLQPESLRALLDLSFLVPPGLLTRSRVPVSVIGAACDRLFPAAMQRATAAWYGAPVRIVPGLGHALMLESGWRAAADALLDSLGELAARGGRAAETRAPACTR